MTEFDDMITPLAMSRVRSPLLPMSHHKTLKRWRLVRGTLLPVPRLSGLLCSPDSSSRKSIAGYRYLYCKLLWNLSSFSEETVIASVTPLT